MSATHTSEMDNEDQEDIINKVKEAGKGDEDVTPEDNGNDVGNNGSTDDGSTEFSGLGGGSEPAAAAPSGGVAESKEKKDDPFLFKPKKLSIFAPEGSEEANYKHKIVEKLHETLNQDDTAEPMVEPQVEPKVAPAEPVRTEPIVTPSRKNKPFLPMPNIKPDPKAKNIEESYDFVSQFKGDHHGNPMPKNQYLNSLGLDGNGIKILEILFNLMRNDNNWYNQAYPTTVSYVDVIQDIIKVVKNLPNFIAKYESINPIKVGNYLKAEILKIKSN